MGRTTTQGFGTIPAQRFMGRCSKTLWPTRNTLLKPKFETKEDVQALSKLKSASNANPMKPIIPCETVLTKISVKTTWRPCTCTGSLGSRSFMVRVGSRLYKRGTGDIQRPTNRSSRKYWMNSSLASSCATSKEWHTPEPNNKGLRRTTRTKRPPVWDNDFDFVT